MGRHTYKVVVPQVHHSNTRHCQQEIRERTEQLIVLQIAVKMGVVSKYLMCWHMTSIDSYRI